MCAEALAMGLSAGEAEEFYDKLLKTANDFEFTVRKYPVLNPSDAGDVDLTREHWRFLLQTDKHKKKVWSFFDIVDSWQPPSDACVFLKP